MLRAICESAQFAKCAARFGYRVRIGVNWVRIRVGARCRNLPTAHARWLNCAAHFANCADCQIARATFTLKNQQIAVFSHQYTSSVTSFSTGRYPMTSLDGKTSCWWAWLRLDPANDWRTIVALWFSQSTCLCSASCSWLSLGYGRTCHSQTRH